jgi:hypothetical protein
MKKRDGGVAVVVGAENEACRGIRELLEPFFEEVLGVAGEGLPRQIPKSRKVRLVVITDPEACRWGRAWLDAIRGAFPAVKILGLFDALQPDQEVILRTAGAVFLGSFDRFARKSKTILSRALRN